MDSTTRLDQCHWNSYLFFKTFRCFSFYRSHRLRSQQPNCAAQHKSRTDFRTCPSACQQFENPSVEIVGRLRPRPSVQSIETGRRCRPITSHLFVAGHCWNLLRPNCSSRTGNINRLFLPNEIDCFFFGVWTEQIFHLAGTYLHRMLLFPSGDLLRRFHSNCPPVDGPPAFLVHWRHRIRRLQVELDFGFNGNQRIV